MSMAWPSSWLNILVAIHLYRNGDEWTPQVDIAKAIGKKTTSDIVYAILKRMRESGFVKPRPRRGRRNYEVKLSADGRKKVQLFLEEIG